MFTKPLILPLFLLLFSALPCELFSAGEDTLVKAKVREQLEKALSSEVFLKPGPHNYYLPAIYSFYMERNFSPWAVPAHYRSYLSKVSAAAEEGLDPAGYLYNELLEKQESLQESKDPATLAEYELMVTHSFLLYTGHLLRGKAWSTSVHQQWHILPEEPGRELALLELAAAGHPQQAILEATPSGIEYQQLKWALAYYKALHTKGGWEVLHLTSPLKPGDSATVVVQLRRRLFAERILRDTTAALPALYDSALADAVKRFQFLHGLGADGVIGTKTLTALNTPVDEKIRRIKLNLERLRWLPSYVHSCDFYIKINIAAFRLDVMRNGVSVMDMAVIVGKPYRKTPVFRQTLEYLVINPFWTVPNTIATKDILPILRRNPGYLKPNGIRLYSGWGEGAIELNPYNVNWNTVSSTRFPYRLTANPGPQNPLGQIKFMFPNPYNVYIHDTQAKGLFEQDQRTFSSGCIRLSKPIELAQYLLQPQGISPDSLSNLIGTGNTINIYLQEKPEVHILYLTAWLDSDGNIRFSPDVYSRDEDLLQYFPL